MSNSSNPAKEIENEKKRLAKIARAKATVNKIKYDDSMIVDRNGEISFICDEKKAMWYVKEGHGEILSAEGKPIVIRLIHDMPEREDFVEK